MSLEAIHKGHQACRGGDAQNFRMLKQDISIQFLFSDENVGGSNQ